MPSNPLRIRTGNQPTLLPKFPVLPKSFTTRYPEMKQWEADLKNKWLRDANYILNPQ